MICWSAKTACSSEYPSSLIGRPKIRGEDISPTTGEGPMPGPDSSTTAPVGADRAATAPCREVVEGGRISHAIARVARAHRVTAAHLLRPFGMYRGQDALMTRLWEAGPQRQ